MSFLDRLFKRKTTYPSSEVEGSDEQAVVIWLKLTDEEFGSQKESWAIYKLEDRLEAAIEKAGVGELDGHEFGEGYCVLFIYGPSADALFDVAIKKLRRFRSNPGSYLIKQYGKPGDPDTVEVRVEL